MTIINIIFVNFSQFRAIQMSVWECLSGDVICRFFIKGHNSAQNLSLLNKLWNKTQWKRDFAVTGSCNYLGKLSVKFHWKQNYVHFSFNTCFGLLHMSQRRHFVSMLASIIIFGCYCLRWGQHGQLWQWPTLVSEVCFFGLFSQHWEVSLPPFSI